MKSGGPWNLRGLRPQAREAAREAARRSGMSVGEWLNSVIRPEDDDDNEPMRNFEPEDRWRQSSRYDEREHGRYRDASWRRRDRGEDDETPRRHRSGPDRVEHRREREHDRDPEREATRTREEIGEVNARLDRLSHQLERLARADAEPPVRQRRPPPMASEHSRLSGAPEPPRRPAGNQDLSIEQAVAEITARQRVLDGETPAEPALSGSPPTAPLSAGQFESVPAALDLSGLERQLRQITTRIEALRPASDLEMAIKGLRADLTEIGDLLTEALPQRAVESLEIEIKALAQRIDHSRESGVDLTVLAGLERGLADVREALRGLTTAENLVGVDEAVKALAQKVDVIVAKDDPAALQQLETAIGALRGIVSHVASNDALTKVAEDVRALAAKVDGLANSAASGRALSALESRIDTLANALNASTEAGHAVPKELEKLLAGLIEKLEWVQLTHTDHAALGHLEDRIAMLVKRLDASDARLGQLDGVERGLADLLVHLDQIRGSDGKSENGVKAKPAAVAAIERDVAEIKQTERRTQDSLEAVHGTVEHVVDRLAMIESDMRDKPKSMPAEPLPVKAQKPAPSSPAAARPESALMSMASDGPAPPAAPKPTQAEPAPRRAVARPPIDPNLPPDHPLEPGSAGRSRQPPSAAERIAASEAAVGAKPPVIPDPGGKPDFIAAARRAAQAAALASPQEQSGGEAAAETASLPKKMTQRLRKLMVAAAVVVIVVGGFHIASRLFGDGGPTAPPEAQMEKPSQVPAALPETNPAKLPAPEALPLPLPSGSPGSSVGAPSTTPAPGPVTGAKPGRQSLNDSSELTAMAAAAASVDDKPPAGGTGNGVPLWASPEITGSLPRAAVPQSAVTPPAPAAPTLGNKLPAAIGGPALRAAALAGDPSAAYEVAMRFAEGHGVPQNSEEAVGWLSRAAKQGFAPAQFRLGGIYEKGTGVKKDLVAARDFYRAAAEQGHGKAMHNLAVLYAEGIDGAADYHSAAQWFRKAADHGITDSQYNLAILYARGIGVEQNFAEAYKWFSLAANQGDKDAAKKRDEVAAHLDQQTQAAARLALQSWKPEPEPADAITVKASGAWDQPANVTPSAPKPKPRAAVIRPPPLDSVKVD